MNAITIGRAIQLLRPGAEYAVVGDTLADVVWLDTQQTQPTDPEISASVATVEADIAAAAAAANRDSEYMARGLNVESMVEALWQRIMESDTSVSDSLQVIRDQVKSEYPDLTQS